MRTLLVAMLSSMLVASGGAATADDARQVPAPRQGAVHANSAAATMPAGTVSLRTVKQASWVRTLVRTGDVLWAETIGNVTAYTTSGTVLGTVPGLEQPYGIATNPAGTVLYSWSVGRITAINPVTRTTTASWPSGGTPRSLVASRDGGYLFYATSGGYIHVLDLATGEHAPILSVNGAAKLFLAGDTLVIATPTSLLTYRVLGAVLTPLATRELSVSSLALAPDGTQFVAIIEGVGGNPTAQRLTAADLVTRHTVTAEYQIDAVAWSPDGSTYVLAPWGQYDKDVLWIHSAADDRLVSRSVWPGEDQPSNQGLDAVVYSSTSKLLYGFGTDSVGSQTVHSFVTASTKPGLSSAFTFTRTQPKVYGQRLVARFRGAGCAPCAVRFTLRDTVAGSRTFTRTVTAGSLDLSLAVKGSGTLTASIPASPTRVAVTHTVLYNVPLRMKITMTGTYTKRNGVLVYSGARPSLRLKVGPARRVRVMEETQFRINGRWRDYDARLLTTNAQGVLRAKSRVARNPSETVRLKYTFYVDRKNFSAVVVSPKLRWR